MDEEDYWNKSENKAFSFDEDDRTVSNTPSERKIFVDDNTSELSYDFPTNDIPLHLLISEHDLNKVLQDQSMDEPQLPKGITPDEELQLLRRKIQERLHAPPVSTTITKIIIKQPYSLECYRSFHDKTELLEEAVNSGNGDAVLAVILFLIKTLQRKYIVKLLHSFPIALNQLINYLMVRLKVSECAEWLSLLGKSNRLAMLQFGVTTTLLKSNSNKTSKLLTIYNDYFNQPGVNTFYAQVVANYVHLLGQLNFKSAFVVDINERITDFQQKEKQLNPKAFELLDRPVLETLSYACSQHKWSENANHAVANSPYKLMDVYKISQSQFEWVALNERSRSQAWIDLEGMFEKKTWHNLKAKSFSINVPLDNVIHQLHSLNAPVAVLNYFLCKINEPNHRLATAYRVNATKTIVDTLSELKDKVGLEKFVETLPAGTDGRFYGENILKNVKTKWKADNLKLLKN